MFCYAFGFVYVRVRRVGTCFNCFFVFVWLCGLVFVVSGLWLEMCVKFGG